MYISERALISQVQIQEQYMYISERALISQVEVCKKVLALQTLSAKTVQRQDVSLLVIQNKITTL